MTQSQLEIGQVLANQWLIIDIKQGGMGLVYLCRSTETGSLRAIKTVRLLEGPAGDDFRRRFTEEVRSWVVLSDRTKSENIVQALHYDADPNLLFLEYVEGLPLGATAPEMMVHPMHATDWAGGIARGMDVLHREFQLVHRDLKPDNILISENGLVPKVTDLGIAKVVQEEAARGTIAGTRGYMAPETYEGFADFRSDIWCYGAVLYRILTGAAPFETKIPLPGKAPPAPGEINPAVAPAVSDLVMKCLEYEAEERCQSFAEILAVLDALPTLASSVDEGLYRFCKEHGFHSPVRSDLPDCLFCDYAYGFESSLRKATEISRGGGDDDSTAITDLAEESATRTGADPRQGPERIEPTVPLSSPRVPEPLDEPSRGETADSKAKVSLLPWVGLVVAFLAVGAGVFLWMRNGDDGSPGTRTPGTIAGKDDPDPDQKPDTKPVTDPPPAVVERETTATISVELSTGAPPELIGFPGSGWLTAAKDLTFDLTGPAPAMEGYRKRAGETLMVTIPGAILDGSSATERSPWAGDPAGSFTSFTVQGFRGHAGSADRRAWIELDLEVGIAGGPERVACEPRTVTLRRGVGFVIRDMPQDVVLIDVEGNPYSGAGPHYLPALPEVTVYASRARFPMKKVTVKLDLGRVTVLPFEDFGTWETISELMARGRQCVESLRSWTDASPDERRAACQALSDGLPGLSFVRLLDTEPGLGIFEFRKPPLREPLEVVLIPGGSFTMGSTQGSWQERADEQPATVTQVRPFFMARTEITRSAWQQVLGTPDVTDAEARLPVAGIHWGKASAFCEKLGLALPTERQWEYACRGGATTVFCYGDDRRRLAEHAVQGAPAVVASKVPNAFGLYDMHGNVAEWCRDWYQSTLADQLESYERTDGDAAAPERRQKRSVRGGGAKSPIKYYRSAARDRCRGDDPRGDIGFRPVLGLPE